MLRLLPDLQFPITKGQFDPLMENVVQVNIIDAGLNDRFQRSLGIHFHIFDTWVKSGGKVDYRGLEGHARLLQDAMAFVGHGNPVPVRHGDLAAAHLSIDYHDTQTRLKAAGQKALASDVSSLLGECVDFSSFAPQDEMRVNLYLDYLGKRRLI